MQKNMEDRVSIIKDIEVATIAVNETELATAVTVKPQKTLEEQIGILKSRKLYIEDDTDAMRVLERGNYYRLRGYYIHLQEKDSDDFKPGVSLTNISALHDFDNELRILLLKLLLDIEVVARARISYTVALAWGPMGYRDISNYGSTCNRKKFGELMQRIESNLANSRERFVKTYIDKYVGQFPIWVAVEIMSFGDLSKLYFLLPTEQKKKIANAYDYLDESLLKNWIQCAAMLRNLCAHNSRIYSRNIPTPISIEKEKQKFVFELTNGKFTIEPHSLFSYLLAIRRISTSIKWNSFVHEFEKLLQKYDCFVEPIRMGLPYQWKQLLFEK